MNTWTPKLWNETYPVGTKVRVTLVRAHGEHPAQTFDTETTSKAWALGHGATVVLIKGKSGGYEIGPGWMEVLPGELTIQDLALLESIAEGPKPIPADKDYRSPSLLRLLEQRLVEEIDVKEQPHAGLTDQGLVRIFALWDAAAGR